jgi:hypothetical protein
VAFYLILRAFPTTSVVHAITVGAVWTLMTLAFEFTFGRWVAKHPWQRLLRDDNLAAGRLWSLVLLSIFLAPLFFPGFERDPLLEMQAEVGDSRRRDPSLRSE